MLGGNSNIINHYDILYLSIGNTISSRVSLIGLYNDAYKYVFGDEVKKSKGVVYYNHNLYNDLDVIPLNGSLNSIKGLKPDLYTYTDSTYKLNKAKLFKLDSRQSNIDNDYTNKHVYGSYDSISMDGESRSLLGYDFGFKNEGMICFWFKMDSSNERLDGAIRTLISVPTGTGEGHKLLIYFDNIYNSLFIRFSGLSEPINTHLTVLSDTWHLFTFNFNNTNIKINLDEQVYNGNLINPFDLSNKITYIGCNYGSSTPGGELNGSIEMLTYDNHYNENIHNTLLSAGSITHITCYDELDRINNKRNLIYT